ncbi:hypothetical protein [Amycolatopsis kentuckyensis]|uniref:hypothetical protein n=1 Tax=Amycolatopsis kentuckyensis TaxID=218823 RepID=UPI000A35E1E9|nr:hypothetical protein [Amycolatopsis kentuckyensis]
MSKVDDILDDELDPEDLDPTPRGGKNGRTTEPKKTGKFLQSLGQRVGFAGIIALTLGAALLGSVSGCKVVPGQPEPRPPYTEDADKPDYQCGYDGNRQCPSTPPPVRASCDEPASWCYRGDIAEAVQR